jgi:guanine deaminase
MLGEIVRGPLLIPRQSGAISFFQDGAIAGDAEGNIQFAGPFAELKPQLAKGTPIRRSDGILLPPLVDIHIHIPQHPIRGRFVEGIAADVTEGRLLAGLNRNVFPAEAKCADAGCAERVVRGFLADTLAHGVVGGAAYMTPSVLATEIALSILPASWSVGLVLMNQNCPDNLRCDEPNLEADVERLVKQFGRRLIITDRFAVAVNSPLRQRAAALAKKFNLRTQTHLNEQVAEKQLVEKQLYPSAGSYTNVYRGDGLLDHDCIAAHCIQMTEDEWKILRDTGTTIAHCPTSNVLLGSGVMRLDEVMRWGISYALGTDVGASPTVSMLAEMKRFLLVHANRSHHATAAEALYRSTLAPADLLGIQKQFGRLEAGWAMSFIEAMPVAPLAADAAVDEAIRSLLPVDIDQPALSVLRVTIQGQVIYKRSNTDA